MVDVELIRRVATRLKPNRIALLATLEVIDQIESLRGLDRTDVTTLISLAAGPGGHFATVRHEIQAVLAATVL